MDISAMKTRKKELKMTLDELSAKSGIPKRTLEDIFRGATKNPRVDTLHAIEKALNLRQTNLEFTNADKDAGVELKHREILSPDEMEIVDTYRAIKSEKGEKTAHAIKSMMKAFLDEK